MNHPLRRVTIKFLTIFAVFLAFLSSAMTHADTIYRYEDGDGKIVFTDTPPDRSHFKKYKPRPVYVLQHQDAPTAARYNYFIPRAEISPIIQTVSQKHDMDPFLVEAIVKAESAYDTLAVSKKGAQGLMQIMPATARDLGLENPFDAHENLDAGIRHFKRLIVKYSNDLDLALAAYNAGEMNVEKYKGVPPFPETIDYVRKIKKYYSQFSNQSNSLLRKSEASKPYL